jgi:hypothetical protein
MEVELASGYISYFVNDALTCVAPGFQGFVEERVEATHEISFLEPEKSAELHEKAEGLDVR